MLLFNFCIFKLYIYCLGAGEKEENRGLQNTQSAPRPRTPSHAPFQPPGQNRHRLLQTCPHQQQTTTTFQRAHISSRGVRGCVKRTPRGRVGLWQTPQGHQPAGQCSAMTQTPSGKSELRGSLWEIGITRFPLGNQIYAVPSGGKIGTTRLTLGNRNYAAPSAKSEL